MRTSNVTWTCNKNMISEVFIKQAMKIIDFVRKNTSLVMMRKFF